MRRFSILFSFMVALSCYLPMAHGGDDDWRVIGKNEEFHDQVTALTMPTPVGWYTLRTRENSRRTATLKEDETKVEVVDADKELFLFSAVKVLGYRPHFTSPAIRITRRELGERDERSPLEILKRSLKKTEGIGVIHVIRKPTKESIDGSEFAFADERVDHKYNSVILRTYVTVIDKYEVTVYLTADSVKAIAVLDSYVRAVKFSRP